MSNINYLPDVYVDEIVMYPLGRLQLLQVFGINLHLVGTTHKIDTLPPLHITSHVVYNWHLQRK